ncbi:DgyrCDS11855 [Dimorphilus gyrociliatus]|uniref:DgyrCDS11855 n=1 Tax=Dimorphilus gyrociliatus TaxID=2664684 RepID=A0A7I8W5S5_9ANNE|nr:DgyrCDS11855 [Dimorphilus gyrociliatus]
MFTSDHIKDICLFEDEYYRNTKYYVTPLCYNVTTRLSYPCKCRGHSIAAYMAAIKKKECLQLTQEDVSEVKELFKYCADYYSSGQLVGDCSNISNRTTCINVPVVCQEGKTALALFQIYHYLVDSDYLKNNSDKLQYIQYIGYSYKPNFTDMRNYYKDNLEVPIDLLDFIGFRKIRLVGLNLGIKHAFFQEIVVRDVLWTGVGFFLVLILIAVYLKSSIMMVATFLDIIFSFVIGYYIYHDILGFKFFPFMNLLSLSTLVAIGADDVFVFCDTWRQEEMLLRNRNISKLPIWKYHAKIIENTVVHATVAILVTSFTTAAAFFTNYISEILAIRCFGIFSGIVVLSNFVLMITFIPPIMVLSKKYGNSCFCRCCDSNSSVNNSPLTSLRENYSLNESNAKDDSANTKKECCQHFPGENGRCSTNHNSIKEVRSQPKYRFSISSWISPNPNLSLSSAKIQALKCKKLFNNFFDNTLFNFISKYPKIFVIVFQILGYLGIFVVFVYPKLDLPETAYVQLFRKSFPMEAYEKDIQFKFNYVRELFEGSKKGFSIHVILGIVPTDNGDHFNPKDRGFLKLDASFNFNDKTVRQSLNEFCKELKAVEFATKDLKYKKCFINKVEEILNLDCNCSHYLNCSNLNRTDCCHRYEYFKELDINYCYAKAMKELYDKNKINEIFGFPYFDDLSKIRAIEFRFQANQTFSLNYRDMKKIIKPIQDSVKTLCIKHLKFLGESCFVTARLDFYDIQKSLQSGTFLAVAVSLAISTGVMLLTSLNVLITLYAMFTVGLSIFATMAILVLFGWKLNVLESTTVAVAVGLSIDFSLHYGVAYRLSNNTNRVDRVHDSFKRVGTAVFMAGVTTFTTGLWMMPSKILAYNQMGEFLMTVMVISWLFSTFFMQSVCYLFGPEGNFLQLPSWFAMLDMCSKKFKSCINYTNSYFIILKKEDSKEFVEHIPNSKKSSTKIIFEDDPDCTEKILAIEDIN